MKYVKNEGRYDLAYTYMKGAQQQKVEFIKRRLYMDTGNIATTGITEVDDDVFKALQDNKAFTKALKNKVLEVVEAPKTIENKAAALEEENAKLKAELEAAKSAATASETSEDVEALKKENADMKAKLEALAKKEAKANKGKGKDKGSDVEPEGF